MGFTDKARRAGTREAIAEITPFTASPTPQ